MPLDLGIDQGGNLGGSETEGQLFCPKRPFPMKVPATISKLNTD